MMNYLSVMEKIRQTDSLKEKERLLKENDSVELREYLDLALNPYKVFYVSKFPTDRIEGKAVVPIAGKGIASFKILCGKLASREISGHVALNTILETFSKYTKQEAEWFRLALTKESIGVGCTPVNKALGDIIPTFEVMLADNKQPDINTITYPVIVQPKLDGFRAVYIPGLGLMGRNGKKIRNENLRSHFDRLYAVSDFVFDGELYGHNVGFNEIASILNSETKTIPNTIKYYVYDGMELQDWTNQSCKLGYNDRMRDVCKYGFLNTVKGWTAETKEQVEGLFKQCLEDGYEGIMLKDPNGKYQWKRVRLSSQTMMKLKPAVTYDLPVVGFVEGEGKLKGSLGKINVDFQGITVGVGSGFTEVERNEIWGKQKRYLGVLAEIKGMEVTPDKSIRHPVFIRFRDDK